MEADAKQVKLEKETLIALVTGAQQGDAKAMEALFEAFYKQEFFFAKKR